MDDASLFLYIKFTDIRHTSSEYIRLTNRSDTMKAVTYQGVKDVEVKEVEDRKIEKSDDMLVKITSSAICGSDLHLVHGMIPNLPKNYVVGHEPIGIVEEVGRDVTKLKKGDRVIIPFTMACGQCYYCQHHLESQCDNSNPEGEAGGYLGYSPAFGGYAGAQAELLRVPFANFSSFKVPEDSELEDEKLLFLSDILPTRSEEHTSELQSRENLVCRLLLE